MVAALVRWRRGACVDAGQWRTQPAPTRLQFLLSPRADGTGIVANDLLVELCNLAGIRNISIKVRRGVKGAGRSARG